MRGSAPHADMNTPPYNILSAHQLRLHCEAQALIECAERSCVLVNPWIDLWPSLKAMVRRAAARGACTGVALAGAALVCAGAGSVLGAAKSSGGWSGR